MSEEKKRTLSQNSSLHKLFEILSEELNTNGLDARLVLKPTYQIWWTPEMIKRDLFKPLMKAMLDKESTTQLNTAEVDKVFKQLQQMIGEKWGLEIYFPSMETTQEYLKSIKE
jgi:hypothetical protein